MEPTAVAQQNKKAAEPECWEHCYIWQMPVRIFHWVNAAAVTVLFATGLWIAFPLLTSPGEAESHFLMGRVRQIHFIAAYAFLFGFLLRSYWFFAGNPHARSGFPYVWRRSWWKDITRQAFDYLRLEPGHPHLGHNALAGLIYTIFVIGLGTGQIVTGFALYSESNPGGFWDSLLGWVVPLLGGSFSVHMWHHLFAWGLITFAIVHIYIVFFDARVYRDGLIVSMITGFKYRPTRDTTPRKDE